MLTLESHAAEIAALAVRGKCLSCNGTGICFRRYDDKDDSCPSLLCEGGIMPGGMLEWSERLQPQPTLQPGEIKLSHKSGDVLTVYPSGFFPRDCLEPEGPERETMQLTVRTATIDQRECETCRGSATVQETYERPVGDGSGLSESHTGPAPCDCNNGRAWYEVLDLERTG